MISLLVALVIGGAILFVISRLPIDGTIKMIINVVVIVFLFLYCLQVLGLWHGISLR
jgi:hypothetical protein